MSAEIELVHTIHEPRASDILWEILNERSEPEDANTNISHTTLPRREHHDEFVQNHPFRQWQLIRAENEYVGQIRLTYRNEIGVGLLKRYRGKGYGPAAVKKLIETTTPMPEIKSHTRAGFVANINPKNERSIAMFKSLGFRHIQNTYFLDGKD